MTLRLTGSAIGRVNWVPFLRCERGLNYTVSLRRHYSGALEPKTPEREWLDSEQWIAVFNGPEIGHLTELFIHYNASSLSDSLSAVNSAALCALVGKWPNWRKYGLKNTRNALIVGVFKQNKMPSEDTGWKSRNHTTVCRPWRFTAYLLN